MIEIMSMSTHMNYASMVWDLITAQSGKHHWLQEGFATYYALLAERHILVMTIL